MVLALVGLTKVKPKQPHKPSVAKDTASSNTYTKLLYGLSEGEIYGLADGAKSIKLDGTPIVNDDGQPNFNNVRWELRTGTLDQSHIAGFPSVENETPINVELRHDRPLVRSYNNPQLSALRVRLSFNGLKHQKENGDIVGYTIEYAFDVATDGGAYHEVLRTKIADKVSNNYTRDYRIELPKGKRWSLRVRRITPNQNSDLFADTMNVAAITEIIDAKLRYPCTALLGLEYDAESFQNIAKLTVRAKGVIIQVPSNYNASTRTYTGFWDGTFKREYSNNPAWVFYDLCTNKRYGLGERLAGLVDKWKLYQLGQYCDEMVDDGKGGQEPRFSCNIYIQKLESAYTLLQNIASTFRAMSYWNGEQIVLDADVPKEPVYTFSRANVVGGEFIYTGTRARDRHTVARVAWNNPNNDFEVDYEFVRDENAIAKYGVRMLEINAVGCTSQGQAQRQGIWALKSEQLETQTVSFKTGLMGFIPQVGQIINIADDVFAGRTISGRIVSADATTKQLTLDRQAGKVGDTITLNTAGQVQTAKIVAVNNPVLTLDKAVGQTDNVWAIISDDLRLMQFRVMSVKQNNDLTFDVQGLQYEKQKFDAVDNGASITLPAYSVSRLESIESPTNVTIVSSSRVEQGVNITVLTINWQQVANAVAYRVEWQKDDIGWQIIPKVAGLSVDIEGVYSGNYLAKVIAIDAYGNESLPAFSTLTQVAGKTGRPPRLARLSVQGKLFGMDLAWSFNKGSDDTNFTEIQVSPDGRANITTLGTFAYPTNKHEITGLQGNLTQYYRARIVDKLGNTSDWTAWVVGTTSAQADKVLDLISGQISQSHLDQSLRTPIGKILPLEQRLGQQIGKIGSLEGAVAGLNGQLDTLNQSLSATQNNITTTQSELNTTKQQLITTQNTLNTAVANITTERSRINSAIRDITALQTANNAKTQELANLTQTVGSHTSSIRELGVTTDELSQRYNQLKTATNNVTSEINTIKQTQVGQATSIDRINARFDNLVVGGRNYLLNSNFARNLQNWENWGGNHVTRSVDNQTLRLVSNNTERWRGVAQYVRLNKNTSYILSFDAKANVGSQIMLGYHFKANSRIIEQRWHYVPISNVFVRYSVQISILDDDSLTGIYLMIGGQALTNHDIELKNLKLEIGNIATDWTPAPEDVQSQLDSKATIASLDELRQIQATKDQATASQISNLTANVTTAQQTANTANSKANTATTKADDGIRRANNAQSTANTANNKADTANTNAQNAKRTADDALGKANTANSTITAEQRARADADSSLANRITALDAAYKQADTELTTRLAREETARASGDNANAQAVRNLESTVNGINGRVGTAESKIGTLERTTANTNQALATAQSQLNARFDNLVVGGRNLLRNSKENHIVGKNHINQSGVDTWILPFAVSPISVLIQNLSSNEIVISYDWQVIGDNVSGVFWAEINAPPYGINNTKFITVNNQNKSGRIVIKSSIDNWRNSHATALKFRLDNFIGMLIIRNAKLEIGNIATDWTPAPEDSNWLIIDQKTDLNSLTETSKYFIRNTQNPNSPVPPHWLFVEVDNGFNDRIKQTVTQDNDVKNQWVRHRLNGHWGAWEKMANASELQNVQATIDNFKLAQATKNTATAQQITTLQTTLNGHTSSIQQHTQSINGLNAQWTLKVESGGIVGGMGLASNNGKSRLALRADIIDIADSRGSKKPMFSVLTKTQTINGVQVPAGVYLNSAYIAKGSIDNAKIGIAEIDTLNIRNQAVSVVASIKENINNIPFVNVGNHNSTKSVYLNSQSGKTLVNLVLFNLSWSASNYSTAPIFIVKLYCNNIEFDSFSLKVTTNQLSVTLNSINTSSPSSIAEYKAIIFADTKYSVLLSGYTLTVTNLKR